MLVEVPGFGGKTIDMRRVAMQTEITASNTQDRWRQLARQIMDRVGRRIEIYY